MERGVYKIKNILVNLAIQSNAHALAKIFCFSVKNANMVPIVEPEVLMDDHSAKDCLKKLWK